MKLRLLGLLAGTAALAFTTSFAQAADLPRRTAPVAPIAAVPLFTWTGFYVGAQVGYGFSDNGDDNPFFNGTNTFVGADGFTYRVDNNGFFNDDDEDGFLLGAHAGYNVQFGSFVVGVEGDIEWADIGGDNNGFTVTRIDPVTGAAIAGPFTLSRGSDLEFIGSLRARIGFAFDRTLIYATGGLAFASFDDGDNTFAFNSPFFDNGDDDTEWGWTIGAGVEYAFTNNLTARLEYRYTTFDRDNNRFFVNTAFDRDNDADFHAVRLGVSYKF